MANAESKKLSWGARFAVRFIGFYQRVTPNNLGVCRFTPSCSNYGLDAYKIHGFWRGTSLTVRRIFRCNPWGGEGEDFVPPAKKSVGGC